MASFVMEPFIAVVAPFVCVIAVTDFAVANNARVRSRVVTCLGLALDWVT